MNLSEKKTLKYQQGGAAPAPAPDRGQAPAGGQEDPMVAVAQMMMQAVQANDGQMALQACSTFLQLIQQAGGGQGAPAPAGGEPTFGKGGRLIHK